MLAEIKGFIKNSLIEWQGKITSVIFLPYCNLRCRFCHAPHLVLYPEELDTIPIDSVVSYILENDWIDGVVITGGEPTIYGSELIQLIKTFKYITSVYLETNGTNPKLLDTIIRENLVDGIAMDIKAPLKNDKWEHIIQRKVNLKDIKRSIELVLGLPNHEFRITVVPEFTSIDDIEEIAERIEGANRLAIQKFNSNDCLDLSLKNRRFFSIEKLEAMKSKAEKYVKNVIIR